MIDFSDTGLLGSYVTTALRCDGGKMRQNKFGLSSVTIDLFHQTLGSEAFVHSILTTWKSIKKRMDLD